MAEERTLGLARAPEPTEDLSKEELQRRMDQARDSISNTVTEIKETVANQVQAVKDTLDWREQFRRRPVACSLGAMGAGFLVGCAVANIVLGDDEQARDYPGRDYLTRGSGRDYYDTDYRSYAAQPVLSQAGASMKQQPTSSQDRGNGHAEDEGPGLIQRLTQTPAYGRVRDEVTDIGDNLIQELTKTAKVMVVPAIIASLKKFLGEHLPQSESYPEQSAQRPFASSQPETSARNQARSYQPSLERNPEVS
jgi:hypothetical protein